MPDVDSIRVIISGRVQAVWYRGWTVREASARGLAGWVRNCRDGRVEALFFGPVDDVADMLQACRTGPPAARVDDIAVFSADPPDGAGFTQRPTA